MPHNQQAKDNMGTTIKTNSSGTDPQKVRQEIKQDVKAGVGEMTSREAGAMND